MMRQAANAAMLKAPTQACHHVVGHALVNIQAAWTLEIRFCRWSAAVRCCAESARSTVAWHTMLLVMEGCKLQTSTGTARAVVSTGQDMLHPGCAQNGGPCGGGLGFGIYGCMSIRHACHSGVCQLWTGTAAALSEC